MYQKKSRVSDTFQPNLIVFYTFFLTKTFILGMNKSKKTSNKKSPSKTKQKQGAEKVSKTSAKAESVPQTQTAGQSEQVTKVVRRSSLQQQSSKAAQADTTQKSSPSNLIAVASPQKSTSLLLSNNLPKKLPETNIQQAQTQIQQHNVEEVIVASEDNTSQSREDKEINEALQAIVQQRVSSPTIKTGKVHIKYIKCLELSVVKFQKFSFGKLERVKEVYFKIITK